VPPLISLEKLEREEEGFQSTHIFPIAAYLFLQIKKRKKSSLSPSLTQQINPAPIFPY
jgi:hypothetical protein